MVNYNNSKVYKIVSDVGNMVYIGSTTKNYLSSRLAEHRTAYKTRNNGIKKGKYSSYQLFDAYGPENCNIYLLELVNCDTKNELLARERHHIETIDCINKVIPGRTQKESGKIYREANKHVITEKRKISYEINKDVIIEKAKEYYEENKDVINEKRNKKYQCDCGSVLRFSDKARHLLSKKHINAVVAVVSDDHNPQLQDTQSNQPPVVL
jgi:hypothetical protein